MTTNDDADGTTERWWKESQRHKDAGYLPRSGSPLSLQQRACRLRSDQRGDENPYFPGIPCAECDKMAVEGSFWCEDHGSCAVPAGVPEDLTGFGGSELE